MRPLCSVISAGGVVFRRNAEVKEILVVKRRKNVESKWKPILCQLPKGHVEPGETIKEAALREVFEETGYRTCISEKVGTASWSYERSGTQFYETVHYFLMSVQSHIHQQHDDEFDEVCWVELRNGEKVLSYPEEQQLLREILNCEKLPNTC